jgi:hypothetical protein
MKEEASNHEEMLQELIQTITESEGLDSTSIEENTEETVQKATEMMKTYLGEDPDGSMHWNFYVWRKAAKLLIMRS